MRASPVTRGGGRLSGSWVSLSGTASSKVAKNPNLRSISRSARLRSPMFSPIVRRKRPLIAHRAVYDSAPLHVGLPNCLPFALALLKPAWMRSISKSRSNSATALITFIVNSPVELVRSTVTLRLIVRMALFVAVGVLNLKDRRFTVLKFAAIRRLSRCSAGLLKVYCQARYSVVMSSFQDGSP